MIFAKYTKPLLIWLGCWCLWLVVTGTSLFGLLSHSPLVWPNVWGVIDWLVSSAAFVALWMAAGREFRRDLPKRNRFHDLLMSGYFLARGFALIALLSIIGAVRVSLYRGNVQIDWASFHPSWREPSILELPFILCMVVGASGIGAFLARVISISLGKYDQLEG